MALDADPNSKAAYVAHALVNAIVHQTAVFFPLSGAIPSAQSLSDALRHTKMDVAFVVPAFIEEMSNSPVLLDHISSNLEILIYTGGDVPQGCGDIVSSKIPIINFYGNTEGASLALVREDGTPPGQEWKYLTFHPKSGAEFRPYADNLYELYIVRKPELERHQQIFTTFPNQQEFKTNDLFIRHPVEPHLWSHRGRTDDIIVFLTGEKVNPVTVEQYIFSQHPEITGVIMVGSQRFQAALLLELAGDKTVDERATMIDGIWPSVEKVNTACPAYARITKSHVMFTDPQRPMSRSPKGTIQRKATLLEYQNDIDALYLAADSVSLPSNHTDASNRVDVQNGEELRSYLKNAVLKVCGQTVGDDENFFVWGMDSLQALLLTRELQHGLQLQGLTTRPVYQNPSIRLLTEALQLSSVDAWTTKPTDEAKGRLDVIDKALRDHQNLIDRIAISPRSPPSHNDRSEKVILLTGSTGFLGSYLLDALLASEATTHIYCLNRSSDSGKLQVEKSRARGLSTEIPANRVSFLAADLSKEDFGLGPDIYGDLLHRVTGIVHNAWPVNFNIPLSSFWPQLTGVVNLIRFATVASHTPSLLYISSVSAVSNLGSGTMPEEVADDHDAPDHMGYGESKHLSERVLKYASRKLPSLRIQIARVGQVAGPVQGPGQWTTSEWLPSLVRSSLHIAAVPESLGPSLSQINWIPVDVLAQILVELVSVIDSGDDNGVPHASAAAFRPEDQASHAGSCHVFNLVNPRHVSWQSILPTITSTLSTVPRLRKGHEEKTVVETVSFDRWIEQIRQDMDIWMSSHAHDSHQQLEALFDVNPAVKLLDFYEAEARIQKPCNNWDTRRAERASVTLRELEGIHGIWLEKWIRDWLM
jgi:thioester reductase-like protein